MSLERLSSLALLSLENEQAKNLDFRKAFEQFANAKTRQKNFKFLSPASKLRWPT